MHHLFEDIFNPEKVSVLRSSYNNEYIDINDIGGEDIRDKIVLPNEGETYTSFYKDYSLYFIILIVNDDYISNCKLY